MAIGGDRLTAPPPPTPTPPTDIEPELTGWEVPWAQDPAFPSTEPGRIRIPRRLQFYRSPPDQPPWARPALLVVAALAGIAYAWAIGSDPLENFYGWAARSMSLNPRNFFFGAVDPWGTVTVDKLPGSLWVDALSIRVFGFSLWSIVLPQVIEGVLTILVLYRAVRRLAGPVAGLASAIVLAASPVTVLLARGNIPDSLMILLLVLAADATSTALATGNGRKLLLAGVWVGLAFQAKMLDAWLIVPALFLAYLLAGIEAPLRRRLVTCVKAGLVTLGVSLSYMLVATAVPAGHRPYFDGSADNSLFTQVFVYNGLDRFRALAHFDWAVGPPPRFIATLAGSSPYNPSAQADHVGPGLLRLLDGWFAQAGGWLLPLAGVSLVCLLVLRRRHRTDPIRAAAILWGTWTILEFASLSSGVYLRTYYVAAMMPAVAALVGIGWSVAWQRARDHRGTRVVVAVAVVGTALYAAGIVAKSHHGVAQWVLLALGLLTIACAVLLLAPQWSRPLWRHVGLLIGLAAVLLVPVAAIVSSAAEGLGPFDTPLEPAATSHLATQYRMDTARRFAFAGELSETIPGGPGSAFAAIDSSYYAEDLGILTTREVLPIGGFSGAVPSPTLAQVKGYVAQGRLSSFIVPIRPADPGPIWQWVIHHCVAVNPYGEYPVLFYEYHCSPQSLHSRPHSGRPAGPS